ncbi:hypothetical protein PHMEG_00023263 [Phytophthora megakarya]|uniref:MARVEL domain-containing protein n=1 Tax=Phytophthora megakarya TaxID=4795 RepID=A0A225VJS7_9STRA|nr:hypothetical protein PHMEG_00023263 [Phytophthora megakarya]
MRTLLRFFQFGFSLVALATLSRGFRGATYYGYSTMLGSRSSTFAHLMTYTGFLVGLFLLLFVELLRKYGRPSPSWVEQLMDILLSILLLVAAIVMLVSDYVANCSVYGYMLRCNQLKTSVVFMFLASLAFFVSFVLDCCEAYTGSRNNRASESDSDGEAVHGHPNAGYHAESTPTGATTSKDASNRV